MQNQDQFASVAKSAGDALSFGVALGTMMKLLPAVAALFTIVWTGIRIYETETVRRLIQRVRGR
jgi:hypothetical protein